MLDVSYKIPPPARVNVFTRHAIEVHILSANDNTRPNQECRCPGALVFPGADLVHPKCHFSQTKRYGTASPLFSEAVEAAKASLGFPRDRRDCLANRAAQTLRQLRIGQCYVPRTNEQRDSLVC